MRPPIHRLSIFFLLLGFLACDRELSDLPRPDLSGIEADVVIRRFDRDLFALDTSRISEGKARLDTVYGEFAALYFDRILGISDPTIAPQGPEAFLKGFVTYPSTRRLYDTIQIAYPDLDREIPHFRTAFRTLKALFPDRPTPRITTFLSEFSIANFIFGDDELAIGLDFYLGSDYPYSLIDPTNGVFSAYLTRTYNRDHLLPRSLKPLVEDIIGPVRGERLIDHIIRDGKVQVLLEGLLPGIPDTALYGFTPDQVAWCESNEKDMWAFLLSENLLYSTDYKAYRKYVEYSPHSPGMPAEAPGRTGDWIGARIVRAWLDRHPDRGLDALADPMDAQVFLDESRYKPRL